MIERHVGLAEPRGEVEAVNPRVAALITQRTCGNVELQVDRAIRLRLSGAVQPGDISDHLMSLIVEVQRAAVDRADQLREVEGEATGRARRRVVQAGEVRLPLRIYVNVGLQVVYINALEDDVAPQAQAKQMRNI